MNNCVENNDKATDKIVIAFNHYGKPALINASKMEILSSNKNKLNYNEDY
jgi:hypothetical protein